MTNDESRALDRSADLDRVDYDGPDEDTELHLALAELEATGVALRDERDRIAAELWRWRFTWFWSQVDAAIQAEAIVFLAQRAHTLLDGAFPYHRDDYVSGLRDVLGVLDWFAVTP